VNKPEMEFVIRLKRPQGQYSIYDDHPENKPETKKDESQSQEQKAPEQKPQ
jgi:hypothetical protein